MTPDDRDIRKPKTPPAGVSTQLARTPPTIEDPTPIGAIPVDLPAPEFRRATAADVARVEKLIVDHSAQDVQAIGELRSDLRAVNLKSDDTVRIMGDGRVAFAEIKPHIESLVTTQRAASAVATAAEVATAAAKAKEHVREQADRRKRRWEVTWSIVKWTMAPIVAFATLAVEHWVFK